MLLNELIQWYKTNKRDLPWRKTTNPYFIWISEIMLQQTRVEQAKPYYFNFLNEFPTIQDLAFAPSDKLMRVWQGLGYYSRARNMQAAANQILSEFQGEFPKDFDSLLKIKGIGPYTAAAVSSIAFGEKSAVVDGNVYRVLSRYFAISTPIDSNAGKKEFYQLANEIISESDAGIYNQAIMELGAVICKPRNPDCTICPVRNNCLAFAKNNQGCFPVKTTKTKTRERFLNYLVLEMENTFYVQKRAKNDVLKDLYEFYLIETDNPVQNIDDLSGMFPEWLNNKNVLLKSESHLTHILSHQKLQAHFFHLIIKQKNNLPGQYVTLEKLFQLPKPRMIEKFVTINLKL